MITQPNFIDDNTPVKCPLACMVGKQAPDVVKDCWHNTIAEIQNIIETEREQDENQGEVCIMRYTRCITSFLTYRIKQFNVKHCLSRSTSDNTDYDVIIIHTQRLYEIPHERRTGTQTKISGGQTRMQKISLKPIASTSSSTPSISKSEEKSAETSPANVDNTSGE